MFSVAELYEPLIERDLAAVPAAVAAFRAEHDSHELFLAVARFAVLAFAPSEHSKHALLAVVAAHDLRDEYGDRWDALLTECARYVAASRQPWSEPPLLDPPAVEAEDAPLEALQAAIEAKDRLAGERWLAANLSDPNLERNLIAISSAHLDDFGSNLLITSAAFRLATLLGEKGRFAVLRAATWQLTAGAEGEEAGGEAVVDREKLLALLIGEASAERGSLPSIHRVLLFAAAIETRSERALSYLARASRAPGVPITEARIAALQPPPVYSLARDYAQALLAWAVAKRLRGQFPTVDLDALIVAAELNRQHGESFDEWSLA